jgi:antibiotic biosynthesis monooxygenase
MRRIHAIPDTRFMTVRSPLLFTHPNLQFRIDAFTVPLASRAEFEATMHHNRAFIDALPGFVHHVVFEKTSGPSTFDIVTVTVWENPDAIAAASEQIRAYYQSIGFDLPGMFERLDVTASLGYYHAPLSLQ